MYSRPWIFVLAALTPACHCESASYVDTDSEVSTGTWGVSGMLMGSSSESTGTPFDASRWIGRYHYENPIVDQWGNPYETNMLVNFEIFEDSTAIMFYDHCTFDIPKIIVYEWAPDQEPGWIELYPGTGESSLRFLSGENLDTLRVNLIEPCRELRFEADGLVEGFFPVYPGASCWLNRCGHGQAPPVGYCEGEEPPPCP